MYTSDSADADARPQAWAKNVISVGGVQHFNNSVSTDDSWLAGNGSIGPAQDGRNKPDLCAYYDSVWTSDLQTGVNNGEGNHVGLARMDPPLLRIALTIRRHRVSGCKSGHRCSCR